MGWWSTDIMGGDTPLDFEDEFFGICNVEKFPEGGGMASLTKEDITNHLDEIIASISKEKYDQGIGYQVLAVIMLKAGAPISSELKFEMVKACQDDEWAQEVEERQVSVLGLINALEAYDNKTPIKIKSRGLFEVMAEKLGNNQ